MIAMSYSGKQRRPPCRVPLATCSTVAAASRRPSGSTQIGSRLGSGSPASSSSRTRASSSNSTQTYGTALRLRKSRSSYPSEDAATDEHDLRRDRRAWSSRTSMHRIRYSSFGDCIVSPQECRPPITSHQREVEVVELVDLTVSGPVRAQRALPSLPRDPRLWVSWMRPRNRGVNLDQRILARRRFDVKESHDRTAARAVGRDAAAGRLDLGADVQTLRAAFEETMKRVPVADDIERDPDNRRCRRRRSHDPRRCCCKRPRVLPWRRLCHRFGGHVRSVGFGTGKARRHEGHRRRLPTRSRTSVPGRGRRRSAAYEGLLGQGVDPRRIALVGESAGCGLAVATLLGLRDVGLPLPCGAFLMSPYVDLTLSGETLSTKETADPILTPNGLRLRVPEFVNGADPAVPYISPLFGDLRGLPPLLIQVGSTRSCSATRCASRRGPRWTTCRSHSK